MISIFYPPYAFGGDAIYLQRLCRELVRNGHEVDVIHCADSYHFFRKEVHPAEFPSNDGITVHRLQSGFGSLGPLVAHQTGRPALTARRIAEILDSKPFDVVHYHNISLFGPGLFEIAASNPAVKLYTAHDYWLICPTSVMWKNRSRACDAPTCWSCTIRHQRPPQLWRSTGLMRRAAAQIDQFIAPSRFCAEMHRSRGFEPAMEVLPYFLDPPAAEAEASPHTRPYFLFVGRLEEYKGVQDILPAFQGRGDYDLLIAGAGRYEDELHSAASGLDRVKFVGWISPDQLGRYYQYCLAIVVPSLTFETFGMIVIEAFARGAPVIARDLGVLPEVSAGLGGGVVFRSLDDLRARLDELANDQQLRARLGQRGREVFLEHWTPEAHLSRYFELIARARQRDAR